MSTLSIPWIDPLSIYEAIARLGLYHQSRDLRLNAKIQMFNPSGDQAGMSSVSRGAPRQAWLDTLMHTYANARPVNAPWPIVTIVLDHMDGRGFYWRPLTLDKLPAWLKQLSDHGFQLDETSITKKVSRLRARLRARSSTSEERIRIFGDLVRAASYPGEGGLGDPLNTRATALSQEIQSLFNVFGASSVMAVAFLPRTSSTFAEGRARWRQQRGHSIKPPPLFFGKEAGNLEHRRGALFAGVELEMELASELHRNVMSAALFHASDSLMLLRDEERLHIEYDGSLNRWGVEAVLRPHEIGSAHGEAFWRAIWKAACDNGASDAEMRPGMHIHVNAAYALSVPRGTSIEAQTWAPIVASESRPDLGLFSDSIGFFIDLITSMLAGGPHGLCFQPINQPPTTQREAFYSVVNLQRRSTEVFGVEDTPPTQPAPRLVRGQPTLWPAASAAGGSGIVRRTGDARMLDAFGRPNRWGNSYAIAFYSLMRKSTDMRLDRYRAVNWQNRDTIEFRVFGPNGFDGNVDWINVATQMTAAIVAYAQHLAGEWFLPQITGGSNNRNPRAVMEAAPRWLRVLHEDQELRPFDNGDYCMCLPGTAQADRDHPLNPQAFTSQRHAEVYLATIELWARFATWIEDNSPRFDTALVWLRQHVFPRMPSAIECEQLRGSPQQAAAYRTTTTAPDPIRITEITGRTSGFLMES